MRVFGRVQGVGFRYRARDEAEALGLAGRAKNEPDGSVALDVEGEEAAVEKFLKWCRRGPWLARVDRVEARGAAPYGFAGFEILK